MRNNLQKGFMLSDWWIQLIFLVLVFLFLGILVLKLREGTKPDVEMVTSGMCICAVLLRHKLNE